MSAGVAAAVGERRPDMAAARAEVNRGLTDEPWLLVTVWIDEVEHPAEAIQLLCGAWAAWVASGELMIFVGVTGMAVEGVQLVTERQ